MSRIGAKCISLPDNVFISSVSSDGVVNVSGPLGAIDVFISRFIDINVLNNKISLNIKNNNIEKKSFWGLYRSKLANAIKGVSVGFRSKVKLIGVGYRASINKNLLFLSLGFSHAICVDIPSNLSVSIEDQTTFFITGIDKQSVSMMASKIKTLRPPEPYKGKGIIIDDGFVFRKEGKR